MSAVLVDSRRVGADPRGRRRRCGLDHRPSIGADSGVGGVVVRGVRTVCRGRLSPSVRAPHVPPRGRRPVGHARLRSSDVPELGLSWSVDHRAHHADTDGSGDPHPVTRGAWFAHIGSLFRRRQASADVTRPSDLWAVAPCGCSTATTPPSPSGRTRPASGHRGTVGRPVVRAACGRVPPCRRHAAGDVLRELARSSRRHQTLRRRLLGAGQRAHRPHHLRRGISQLPSPIPLRLPQQSSLVLYDPSRWLSWTLARIGMVNGLRTASADTIAKAVTSARAAA